MQELNWKYPLLIIRGFNNLTKTILDASWEVGLLPLI